MGLQEPLLPPGEQEIAQRRRIVLAVDIDALDGIEGREFLCGQRDRQLGDADRRVGKFRLVGGIAPQRPVGLDGGVAEILRRALAR